MMKTLLLVGMSIASLVSLGIAAVGGGVLVLAENQTMVVQKPILDAISQQDTGAFLRLCTPEFRRQIDEPVLRVWMKNIEQTLGPRSHSDGQSFQFDVQMSAGVKVIQATSTQEFQRGLADITVVTRDGKLSAISFSTDRQNPTVSADLDDKDLFVGRGKRFLTSVADTNPTTALGMMHPGLRKVAPDDTLASVRHRIARVLGEIKTIRPIGSPTFDREVMQLQATYEITGTKATVKATTDFVFTGLKTQVIGFDFNLVQARTHSDSIANQ